MRQRIVVSSGSVFAEEICKLFLGQKDYALVVVAKSKELAVQLNQELGISIINSDLTKPDSYNELELEKCDIFVSASGQEKEDILTAIYAKNAGAKKIIVLTSTNETEEMLKKLGFNPINPERFAARTAELMITRPAISELVNIGSGESDIIEYSAQSTNLVGKQIGQAAGKNYLTLATYNNGTYAFSKETKIIKNDILILLVPSGKEAQVEKELKEKKS
jgi:trk system potassium uptake protein TrkA